LCVLTRFLVPSLPLLRFSLSLVPLQAPFPCVLEFLASDLPRIGTVLLSFYLPPPSISFLSCLWYTPPQIFYDPPAPPLIIFFRVRPDSPFLPGLPLLLVSVQDTGRVDPPPKLGTSRPEFSAFNCSLSPQKILNFPVFWLCSLAFCPQVESSVLTLPHYFYFALLLPANVVTRRRRCWSVSDGAHGVFSLSFFPLGFSVFSHPSRSLCFTRASQPSGGLVFTPAPALTPAAVCTDPFLHARMFLSPFFVGPPQNVFSPPFSINLLLSF